MTYLAGILHVAKVNSKLALQLKTFRLDMQCQMTLLPKFFLSMRKS